MNSAPAVHPYGSSAVSDVTEQIVKLRDRYCLFCCVSAGDDVAHIVAADFEIAWLRKCALVPGDWKKDSYDNLMYLCGTHHKRFDSMRLCFPPSLEDLVAMIKHEEHDMFYRRLMLATTRRDPGRTLLPPQAFSGKFEYIYLHQPGNRLLQCGDGYALLFQSESDDSEGAFLHYELHGLRTIKRDPEWCSAVEIVPFINNSMRMLLHLNCGRPIAVVRDDGKKERFGRLKVSPYALMVHALRALNAAYRPFKISTSDSDSNAAYPFTIVPVIERHLLHLRNLYNRSPECDRSEDLRLRVHRFPELRRLPSGLPHHGWHRVADRDAPEGCGHYEPAEWAIEDNYLVLKSPEGFVFWSSEAYNLVADVQGGILRLLDAHGTVVFNDEP